MRPLLFIAVFAAGLACSTQDVSAQGLAGLGRYGGGRSYFQQYLNTRPTVSPYLNLLRSRGDTGLPNYQSIVRPQLQARQNQARQQQQMARMQQDLRQLRDSRVNREGQQTLTGHPTRFMEHLHYYPGLSRR